ncbi:MAG: YkgJ family cysteine cluster protein [Phycisphaerales bacterium]|nr:YkgJ family cysteine cluster protein [Phycisphaerales bacterium]
MHRVPAWYERSDPTSEGGGHGLRFSCTSCGNCCSGGPGYVRFSPEEGRAMAAHMGISEDEFAAGYTREAGAGLSLTERLGPRGYDCVFLDRQSVPGKAICAVYEARPLQCRTWPFWPENLRSREHWERAARSCPGMNTGQRHEPDFIRLTVERMLEWEG